MSADETTEKIKGDETEKFFTKPLILIFITVFIDLVGFGIVIPALPYYVESDLFRATPFDIGLLFASYSLMQFVFAPVLGSLSDNPDAARFCSFRCSVQRSDMFSSGLHSRSGWFLPAA